MAPLHIDRRAVAGPHAAEAVDVGREKRGDLRQVGLKTPDEAQEHGAVGAGVVGEEIGAAGLILHRDVQVHGAARLELHGLGHEGGVDAVGQGHLADQALEHHDLVAQRNRIAVQEVDLQLRRARLVDHRVDAEAGDVGILIDGVDQVLVLVDRLEPIGLRRGLGAARAARRAGSAGNPDRD